MSILGLLMVSLSGCPDPAASPDSGWGFELTIDSDPEDGEHWVSGVITFYWKSDRASNTDPAGTNQSP